MKLLLSITEISNSFVSKSSNHKPRRLWPYILQHPAIAVSLPELGESAGV